MEVVAVGIERAKDFLLGGRRGDPRLPHQIEGEQALGEDVFAAADGKSGVTGREAGDEVVLESLDGSLGTVGAVVTRGC